MKLDINKMRKAAGLKTLHENDASPEHVKSEKQLFDDCTKCCDEIVKMCEARLKEKDLTDEHKKQYTALCDNTKKHLELMKQHLASYKE